MMDLTPLDVRKKKGDFRRGLRGYEGSQVDDFLELVADRMEAMARDAAPLKDRVGQLEQQVKDYRDREKALTEALVTAQQMREDMKTQSTREVEMLRKQAEQEADQIRAEAISDREREEQTLHSLRTRQMQFLQSYRTFLEQELSELSAMHRALEMHAGGAPTEGSAPVAVGSTKASSDPSLGRATAGPAAVAAAVAEPAAPQAVEPAASPAAGSAEEGSAEVVAQPTAATNRDSAAPGDDDGSEIEAQLDKALARWEPELETSDNDSAASSVAVMAEPVTVDDEDDVDLVFSDEDVIGAVDRPEVAEPELTAEEAAVDLSFLDFADEEPAAATAAPTESPKPVTDPAVVEREVAAAMGAADTDLIDLGDAFPTDRPAIQEVEPAESASPSIDRPADGPAFEPDAVSGFDGAPVDFDGAFEYERSDDDQTASSPATAADSGQTHGATDGPAEAADGQDEVADFVDSIVFDAETAFNEEPTDDLSELAAEFASEGGHADDALNGTSPDVVDVETDTGFAGYDPDEPLEDDPSSLTLHPMFFEPDPAETPAPPDGQEEGHDDSRRDHWSSSGGG